MMVAVSYILVVVTCIVTTLGCRTPNNNCLNQTCSFVNANPSCTHGCQDGWSGSFCQEICRNRCPACERNDPSTCIRCDKGRYGKMCEKRCDGCIDKECYFNGTCKRERRSDSQEDERSCPSGCRNRSCDKTTSHCNAGCTNISYGKFCNKTCSPNCITCNSPDCRICDEETGRCLNGCKDGVTGPNCSVPKCSFYCNNCQTDGQNTTNCRQLKDTCDDKCDRQTNPPLCDDTCPDNCGKCDCGVCVQCMKGYYSLDCNKTCTGCKNLSCRQDGKCEDGCVDGHSGDMCSTTADRDLWAAILGLIETNDLFLPLLVSSLVLLIALIGFIAWRCRRKEKVENAIHEDSQCSFKPKEKTEYPVFGKCGDIYHEISEEDMDLVPIRTAKPTLLSERLPLPLPRHVATPHTRREVRDSPNCDYITPKDDISTHDELLCSVTFPPSNKKKDPFPREHKFRGKVGIHDRQGDAHARVQRVTISAFDDHGYLTPGQDDSVGIAVMNETGRLDRSDLSSDLQPRSEMTVDNIKF